MAKLFSGKAFTLIAMLVWLASTTPGSLVIVLFRVVAKCFVINVDIRVDLCRLLRLSLNVAAGFALTR